MPTATPSPLIPIEQIEQSIYEIRGHKVMLDSDLARVYGVSTKRLNEQVKRNKDRFPSDFMFRLTQREFTSLRSQNATFNLRKFPPYAFTEQGALMASNVLKSDLAVRASVFVVRAFVRLRQLAVTHREILVRLKEIERKVGKHDRAIKEIIETILSTMEEPNKPTHKIGYK